MGEVSSRPGLMVQRPGLIELLKVDGVDISICLDMLPELCQVDWAPLLTCCAIFCLNGFPSKGSPFNIKMS